MATSYNNPGGKGSRAGIITVSLSTASITMLSPTDLIDGTTTSGSNYYKSTFTVGNYIQFDFSSPKIIDEITHYQSAVAAHGTWQFKGSNDDWTTSYNIGTSFALGTATTQVIPFTGNALPYRSFRWQLVAGAISQSPWIYEIEFKLDDPAVKLLCRKIPGNDVFYYSGTTWKSFTATDGHPTDWQFMQYGMAALPATAQLLELDAGGVLDVLKYSVMGQSTVALTPSAETYVSRVIIDPSTMADLISIGVG